LMGASGRIAALEVLMDKKKRRARVA